MKKFFRALLFFSIMASLAGCSSARDTGGDDQPPDGVMTKDDYREAVKVTMRDYRWPEGFQPSVESIVRQIPDHVFVQNDFELTVLTILNQCAWNLAWMDARQRGDSLAQELALDVLRDAIPTLIEDPEGRKAAEDAAAKASLNDPSGLQLMVQGNCQSVEWTTHT